ncbi:hypothetical protein FANTH_1006 [Fusarium anthophilum]|uniref:Uncharacterized protein n=1 Tax=Fusarium anthophilum TaxID=48485 RepID=A0A8H4ZWV3_9HYPO|nr:hypothetical protein FANTH_1006 [Fusarium anthophilum]
MTSIDKDAATGKANSGRTACTESLEHQSPRQKKRPIDVGIHEESMEDESGDEVDEAEVLQVMGYGSESFFNKIYIQEKKERKPSSQPRMDPKSCPQLQHVLDVLPTRSFMGMHQEASMLGISDFEREMYRRVWCVLDIWDWQMSALLSRPLMIDRTYCKVGLPELTLEGTTPSPMLHLKLQSELIRRLFNRFGPTRNVIEPVDIQEYQKMLEDWMMKFPPIFDLDNPDYDQDALCPWIPLHRHYIHTMGYSMILDPFRVRLATSIDTKTASKAEVQIRSDGIDYALKLMTTLRGFFNHVWPRDAKFHFVIFSIFDTSALFSSILVHDKDGSAPKRQEMLDSFDLALDMIKHLRTVAPNFQLYYKILRRLRLKAAGKVSTIPEVIEPPRKCLKTTVSKTTSLLPDIHATPSRLSAVDCHTEYDTASISRLSNAGLDHNLLAQPNHCFQRHHPSRDTDSVQETSTVVQPLIDQSSMNKDFQSLSRLESGSSEQTMFASISEEELGSLAELWRWKDLDLGIINELNP